MKTHIFPNPIPITHVATTAGKKEAEGPLSGTFDTTFTDPYWGMDSFEQCESKMQQQAVQSLLLKSQKTSEDIDLLFAGDLLNQCIGSHFGLRDFDIPFYGQFGACSTMAQTLSLAAIAVSAGVAKAAIAGTSSHFHTAERQFRLPLEYGGQLTPTAQHTATGAGFALLESPKNAPNAPKITAITTGKIVDWGTTDAANMGAAMAPAAADTLSTHFQNTCTTPTDYSLIVTGDLGSFGASLCKDIMQKNHVDCMHTDCKCADRQAYDLSVNGIYNDCGTMLYDLSKPENISASGCGCSALVFCAHIFPMLERKQLKKVLFVGTGALMSPTSSQQNQSIPSIAHAVEIISS